ncbi:MAG: BON domain-containing protein [Planctomycetota bacterium]|nr:BON domain-containing protein [Planctomycetota bacterium]
MTTSVTATVNATIDSLCVKPVDKSLRPDVCLGTVAQALRRTGVFELQSLEPEISGHDVILRGSVGSYYLKQRAQAAVMELPGVNRVRNELTVTRPLPELLVSH